MKRNKGETARAPATRAKPENRLTMYSDSSRGFRSPRLSRLGLEVAATRGKTSNEAVKRASRREENARESRKSVWTFAIGRSAIEEKEARRRDQNAHDERRAKRSLRKSSGRFTTNARSLLFNDLRTGRADDNITEPIV